jgi:hypothetical protein
MNWLRKAMKTPHGLLFITALVGFGLATMMRKTCSELSCRKLVAPTTDEIEAKTVKKNGKCYKFEPSEHDCVTGMKTVEMR